MAQFLREHVGECKYEPSVLHQVLKKRKSEAMPESLDRPSKMVLYMNRSTWLKAERGWGKKLASPAGCYTCASRNCAGRL